MTPSELWSAFVVSRPSISASKAVNDSSSAWGSSPGSVSASPSCTNTASPPPTTASTRRPIQSGSTSASRMSFGFRRPGRWGRHSAAISSSAGSTAMTRSYRLGLRAPV